MSTIMIDLVRRSLDVRAVPYVLADPVPIGAIRQHYFDIAADDGVDHLLEAMTDQPVRWSGTRRVCLLKVHSDWAETAEALANHLMGESGFTLLAAEQVLRPDGSYLAVLIENPALVRSPASV